MSEHQAQAVQSITISHRIVRADGSVEELGVTNASFKNPLKQAWWTLVGSRLAERRIRKANKRAEALRS